MYGRARTGARFLAIAMLAPLAIENLDAFARYRARIHWPSFYNVVTGKTLALPNLIALQHIPLSPAGVIAKRPAPIALPNSCAA